jgi:hypothetical protein
MAKKMLVEGPQRAAECKRLSRWAAARMPESQRPSKDHKGPPMLNWVVLSQNAWFVFEVSSKTDDHGASTRAKPSLAGRTAKKKSTEERGQDVESQNNYRR